jgi:hypothetical protein
VLEHNLFHRSLSCGIVLQAKPRQEHSEEIERQHSRLEFGRLALLPVFSHSSYVLVIGKLSVTISTSISLPSFIELATLHKSQIVGSFLSARK